jgi:putative hemolysin
VLTYALLLCGQLIPRAIAQHYPEHILCWMSRPLIILTKICGVTRGLLTASLTVVLWILGQRHLPEPESSAPITEEAVTTMVQEGAERGIFEALELELIEGVFEFTETAAREVMVPRVRIEALEVNTTPQDVLRQMSEIGHSRVPVYNGDLDHIVGVLYLKDVMRAIAEGQYWELRHLLHPPLFVPETVQISLLLRTLQQQHLNMAIVIDEHGGVAGLVTIEDLLERLVGEIRDEWEPDEEAEIVQLPDGAWVIQGNVPLWELRERFALPVEESPDYQTLAGFLLARLGRIPKGGETIHEYGYTFTVVDMEGPRIARVKVEQREPPQTSENLATPPLDGKEPAAQEQQDAPGTAE